MGTLHLPKRIQQLRQIRHLPQYIALKLLIMQYEKHFYYIEFLPLLSIYFD